MKKFTFMYIIRKNKKGDTKDMYYKVSPVIIIVFVLAFILLAVLGGVLIFRGNHANKDKEVVVESDIEPVLDLQLSSEKKEQSKVTITAIATTDDEEGIHSVTLPDGSIQRTAEVTYDVTKNGEYTFKAAGNNGKVASMSIIVDNIKETSDSEPYIPEGFSHVEGESDTGFVIEDQLGNQFVWVPVPSGQLTRNTMLDTKYQESSSSASALVNSVAQNYGFYIGRYEASRYEINGSAVAASQAGKLPWTNITYSEAVRAASEAATVFEYGEYKTDLINSYTWDTALSWIDQTVENYSSSIDYGNYSRELRESGATESDIKNNICDLAGNVKEWTTEIFKETVQTTTKKSSGKKGTANVETVSETVNYRVIRGGSASNERPASSHTGYKENTSEAYWGFRMILYK